MKPGSKEERRTSQGSSLPISTFSLWYEDSLNEFDHWMNNEIPSYWSCCPCTVYTFMASSIDQKCSDRLTNSYCSVIGRSKLTRNRLTEGWNYVSEKFGIAWMNVDISELLSLLGSSSCNVRCKHWQILDNYDWREVDLSWVWYIVMRCPSVSSHWRSFGSKAASWRSWHECVCCGERQHDQLWDTGAGVRGHYDVTPSTIHLLVFSLTIVLIDRQLSPLCRAAVRLSFGL